uniref:RWD domain-containing protein n=1 Tax=Strigamia maritima TaxID=126957 RepID=T1JCC5_STRMM
MTDYAEEQRNEIEALESIYPTEFEITEVEPFYKFTIFIKTDEYDEDSDEVTGAACKLEFTYVENYPDSPPSISIVESANMEDDNSSDLQMVLTAEAENNLGMVMIFTLVSTAQELLNTKWDEVQRNKQKQVEKLLQEKEEAEMKKFEGTRVTVESFLLWKAQFDLEMASLKTTVSKEDNKKLTGRELFERDHTLISSDINFLLDGEEDVKVDESLFQEFGDLM